MSLSWLTIATNGRRAYSRGHRLTRQQGHLAKCPTRSNAIDVMLYPVSVRDEHVGNAVFYDIQIVQAVTLDKNGDAT